MRTATSSRSVSGDLKNKKIKETQGEQLAEGQTGESNTAHRIW